VNRRETAIYNLAIARGMGDCPATAGLIPILTWVAKVCTLLLSAYIHSQERIVEEEVK
jgi:hypothetical protein